MFSNKKMTIAVFLVIIFFIYVGVGTMRRSMPFQEIVPLDKGIAVINAANWYQDDFTITLKSHDNPDVTQEYNDAGLCLFPNLINNQTYSVIIKRTDIKGRLLYKNYVKEVVPNVSGSTYVVLVGASIGKAWGFEHIPERTSLGENVVLGNRTIYEFSKRSEIDKLVDLPISVKSVIIKECASYFPRDMETSKAQVESWVETLRSKGITPVLATVVPVTKEHDKEHPKKFDSIIEYNDFIRRYAYRENIAVLDLEKTLRISDTERHLRPDYAQEDGLHIVKKAYMELDKIAVDLINNLK